MKKDFLPKALNAAAGRRACIHINSGLMSTEPHYHDCVEMIYVSRGTVRVFFNNGWHELLCDRLLFVPPGCIHRCVCADSSTEQVVIGFTDELICEEDSVRKGILCPYRTGAIKTGYILSDEDCRDMRAAIECLVNAMETSDARAELSLYAKVLSIYNLIFGVWEERGILRESRAASPVVCRIRDYVAEKYASAISARELARQLNISYSYLAKIMKREFGTSLGNYIIAYRIEIAKKLLLSTEDSVTEIGYACGFASSSAFICHFKAQTGKTPLVFRNEALDNSYDLQP